MKKLLLILALNTSLCLAAAPPCPVNEDVVKQFGPQMVSTGLPFHYNFKLKPPYIIDFENDPDLQATYASGNSGNLTVRAFYPLDIDADHRIYRIMFIPARDLSSDLLIFQGQVDITNTKTNSRCQLTLPSEEVELVHVE